MQNAQPETLTLDRIATPVGEVLLVTDADGAVRALDFADYEARMMRLLGRHAPDADLVDGPGPEAVRGAVEAYFAGDARALDGLEGQDRRHGFPALGLGRSAGHPGGRDAQLRPAGGGDRHRPRRCGRRAWRTARTPSRVIVPCHRVIGANGTLTGYAGGLERKRWLLAHEGAAI